MENLILTLFMWTVGAMIIFSLGVGYSRGKKEAIFGLLMAATYILMCWHIYSL
jgi:predicted membrane protein